jgi:hypothetical protein
MKGVPERQIEKLFHAQTRVEFHGDVTQQIEQALKAQEVAIRNFAKTMSGVSGMPLKIEPKIKNASGPVPQPTAREFVLE